MCTQALSLGLGEQWEKVKTAYAQANRALGDIVKVPILAPQCCHMPVSRRPQCCRWCDAARVTHMSFSRDIMCCPIMQLQGSLYMRNDNLHIAIRFP